MRIYFILFLAFLNGTSEQAARVLLSLYALKLGVQPYVIGLLAAAFSLFPMLLAVQAGRIADRFGVRWLLVFGSVSAGTAMLLPYFVPAVPAIFFAAAMIGLADVIFNVAIQNLVGLLSQPADRARNFNNYSLAASAFCSVGPLAAGFTIDLVGHGLACVYLSALTFVPAALLMGWGHLLPRETGTAGAPSGGLRTLLASPGVVRVMITSSLLGSGNHLYQLYLPVYATTIGLSASAIGVILAMNAGAMFLMRLVLPRLLQRFSAQSMLTWAFFAGAISVTMVPFFQTAAVLAAISFTFGLSIGCGHPLMLMRMFENAPKGRSGEALGLRMTTNHFIKIVLPPLYGVLASALGLALVFWVNALVMSSGGLLTRRGTCK